MSDSMKKTTEMNELLTEANDMELSNETGAGMITKILKCGAILTLSAECTQNHRSCNPFNK